MAPLKEERRNRTRRSLSLRKDSPRRVLAGASEAQLELSFLSSPAEKAPGRDPELETVARELLLAQSAPALAAQVRVEWSKRLRTAAGRAEYGPARILLNCHLCLHGEAEIDRTLRHELAHLLAQFRGGHRRVAPHGPEWRRACADFGIADEARCHTLPFPVRHQARRYLYVCAHCAREFLRTRLLRRPSACLACCRAFNRGRYDQRFKLRLVRR